MAQSGVVEKYESQILKLQLAVLTLKEKLTKKHAKSIERKGRKIQEISGL